jgi:hypothetical protein
MLGLCAANLHAAPSTFAQFQESAASGTGAGLFFYLDNGASNGAELVSDGNSAAGSSIPVTFDFQSGIGNLPADLQGPQAATLTLTSSTLAPVQTSGNLAAQAISGSGPLTDILTITRDSAAAEGYGSRTNLLTLTFTGQLLGTLGGTTPQFSGNTALGDTVSYASDFMTFASGPQDYALAFSSWVTAADGTGLELNTDGNFSSATAAATGTFDSTVTVVPEAGPMAMGLVVLLALSPRRARAL